MQNFKGDAVELKIQSIADTLFSNINISLDQFYVDGYNSSDFLLMLYDEQRMPFYRTIARDAFIPFIKEALIRFQFTGSFDTYLFLLKSLFGDDSDITFSVAAPGKLDIAIDAYSELTFDFIVREITESGYAEYTLATSELDDIVIRGIAGIQNEYELGLLFSEIMPAGITPTISLDFLSKYFWISEEDSVFYDMIDDVGDQIIFIELGG